MIVASLSRAQHRAFKHFSQRLRERYGHSITKSAYLALCAGLAERRLRGHRTHRNADPRREVWRVRWHDLDLLLVFDPVDRVAVTALPTRERKAAS